MKDKKGNRERVNQDIRTPQVRLIDENGNSLGVLSSGEAYRIAMSRGLDLVEISPNARPPVCKIADYGKYNYERQKKEKLTKKNQTVVSIKEIRFNANTDTHDIEFKTKHLKQFLLDGHKVKADVVFKGRMITHPEIGRKLMDEMLAELMEIGKLESPPKMEGKMLVAYLVPDKNKIVTYKAKQAKLSQNKEVPAGKDQPKAQENTVAPVEKEQ